MATTPAILANFFLIDRRATEKNNARLFGKALIVYVF